jgi:tRNA G18 (ribose-2'-O)-methylase SpoU
MLLSKVAAIIAALTHGSRKLPQIISVTDLTDPQLDPYVRLKERDLARQGYKGSKGQGRGQGQGHGGGRFIAEAELVVRRLLAAKGFGVESLLVSTRRLEALLPIIGGDVPVYVAEPALVNQIVGFKFHSGVMAVGLRPTPPTVDELADTWGEGLVRLMILPEISKTDNLGSLIRIAAGLGANAVVVGERCCDPFYRQAVRVSMGAVFDVPILRSDNLLDHLARLRTRGVEMVGAVLAPDAQPLTSAKPSARMGILFGHENTGLTPAELAACDRRVTLPMSHGVDSLNVAVAAGIVMYHFR